VSGWAGLLVVFMFTALGAPPLERPLFNHGSLTQ